MDQGQLNIEVSISQQLRALLAQGLAVPDSLPDEPVQPTDAKIAEEDTASAAADEPPVQPSAVHVLRRDGDWPMRFEGQVLLDISHVWTLPEQAFDHGLALYLGPKGDLCASLQLRPRDPDTSRPVFWCGMVQETSDFEALARRWTRDVLADAARQASARDHTKAKDQSEGIETVFHRLTAQSLRVLQPNSERNKQCLQ